MLVAFYPQQAEEWTFDQLKDAEWIGDMGDFEPLLDALKWDSHFASHNQRNTALSRQIFQ
ncbi:MAG: hypothetical protein RR426_05525 [Oscillospiraceae bacterium]